MAKKKDGVNKSEAIRQLLKTNREIKAKEIVSTLAGKGIPVTEGLVHFVKGQLKGREDHSKKTARVAKVASSGNEKVAPKVALTGNVGSSTAASEVNKSEEIRQLLKTNPQIKPKEIVSTLAGKGIPVSVGLVHFVKGHMKGRKAQKKKSEKVVAAKVKAKVVITSGNVDPLATILKVKHLASEVGGLKKLRALVDALSV